MRDSNNIDLSFIDYEGDENLEKDYVKDWYIPKDPITILDCTGSFKSERVNLEIKLTNGDIIQFSCFLPFSPHEHGKAELSINDTPYDVLEIFNESLSGGTGVFEFVLDFYEDHIS